MRLVALAVAALGSSAAIGQPTIALMPGEALISVEAEGRSLTRPDVMTITAGAVTTGATAAEAVNANAALAQGLIEAVRGEGVEARDIQTSHFGVEPQFEGGRDDRLSTDGRPPRIVGYVARNQVEIRLRDLSAAQSLIGRLFEAGANSVDGPRFSLSDEGPATRTAERMAIAEARAEAENYAAAMGRPLGRLLRISDRRAWTDPGGDERIIISGSRMAPTPIEPGEVETEVRLWVDFALAPQ